jgi:ABC-type nitrate/sulfonate/bicarbonate transport system substrate-binding protein
MTLPRSLALAAVTLAVALAGCGSVGTDRPDVDATLVLAGPPQAIDAPIAAAVQRGFDGAEGVHLQLRAPHDPGAGLRALLDRRADFAVLDAAALSGQPKLVGVMALANAPGGQHQPQVVLATTRERLEEDPSVAKAAVAGILRGYDQTLTDPASSLSDLQAQFPGLDRRVLETRLPADGQRMYPPGRLQGALQQGDPRYDTSVVTAAAGTTHDS